MIFVNRSIEPAVLTKNKAKWLASLDRAGTDMERDRASGKYKHRQIKNTLVQLFAGKCAYCESKIRHVDYGDIEHYMPISKYGKLTFTWTNLLLSCGVCNGSEYKGNSFPLAKDGGPILNSTIDHPNEHLSFFFDEKAVLATVLNKSRRGKVTVETVGLNRSDLREHRSEFVKKLVVLSYFAESDTEAMDLLIEAVRDSSEYAAFAREVFKQMAERSGVVN